MNHWPFILAAYGLTLAALGWLVASAWSAMRAAERHVEALGARR